MSYEKSTYIPNESSYTAPPTTSAEKSLYTTVPTITIAKPKLYDPTDSTVLHVANDSSVPPYSDAKERTMMAPLIADPCNNPLNYRRRRWRLWIPLIIVIVVVLAIVGTGLSASGRCLTLDASSQQAQTYTFDGSKYTETKFDFKSHGIKVNADLRFKKSNSSTGTISIQTASFNSVPSPQIATDDNKYSFRIDPTAGFLTIFSFIAINPPCMSVIAEISLPKASQNLLTVENDNGPIQFIAASDEASFKEIKVSSDNGRVSVDGGLPGIKVSLSSDNGAISVSKVQNSALNLDVKSDNGRVTIDNLTASQLNANSDNGAIFLNSTVVDTVTLDSDNGRITANWVGKSIKAQSDNGAIEVTIPGSIEHVAVDFKSDNGAVKLDLSKSFKGNLELKSSNGKAQISDSSDIVLSVNESKHKVGYKGAADQTSYLKMVSQNGQVVVNLHIDKSPYTSIPLVTIRKPNLYNPSNSVSSDSKSIPINPHSATKTPPFANQIGDPYSNPLKNYRRHRFGLWIWIATVILVVVVASLLGLGFSGKGRCLALDASSQQAQTFTYDGSKLFETKFDFKSHGLKVNADLRFTKLNSNTGTISIKTAAFISVPAPQITTDDNKYLFKIDPTSGVLYSFSFIAFNPPCLSVIAEISLPKSNQNLLTIENDDGPTKFTSVGDEVLFKSINLSSDNGKVTIEGGLPATNVSLKADNGEIVVLKVLNSALGLKLKSDTGKITIDGLTASTLDVSTDNGEISLNATAIDMVTAKSDDGKITANWSGKSIKAQSDHGAIDVAIPGAVEHVAVDLKSIMVQLSWIWKLGLENFYWTSSNTDGSDIVLSTNDPKHKLGYKGAADQTSYLKLESQTGQVTVNLQ